MEDHQDKSIDRGAPSHATQKEQSQQTTSGDASTPTGQNQTRNGDATLGGTTGHGSHAVGTENTKLNENIDGRNPGAPQTSLGDRDAATGRGEPITDPMTSRDPSINSDSN